MADKIITDLYKNVEIHTHQIDTINTILNIKEVPCSGFKYYIVVFDKVYKSQNYDIVWDNFVTISLLDANGVELTPISIEYLEGYASLVFTDNVIAKTICVSPNNDIMYGVPEDFGVLGSEDDDTYVLLSEYTGVQDLWINGEDSRFDIREYTKYISVIDDMKDNDSHIKSYATIDDYNADTTRKTPNICYIEESDEMIYNN